MRDAAVRRRCRELDGTDQIQDEEELEHINTLRTSILEAYAGIFQGLQGQVRPLTYAPHPSSVPS